MPAQFAQKQRAKMSVSSVWNPVYDIHFAGAAGLDIKGTEVLGHVETKQRSIESSRGIGANSTASEGRYLERIYKWAKRVGVDTIRKQVMDDHERAKRSATGSSYSQQFSQIDPWAERARAG